MKKLLGLFFVAVTICLAEIATSFAVCDTTDEWSGKSCRIAEAFIKAVNESGDKLVIAWFKGDSTSSDWQDGGGMISFFGVKYSNLRQGMVHLTVFYNDSITKHGCYEQYLSYFCWYDHSHGNQYITTWNPKMNAISKDAREPKENDIFKDADKLVAYVTWEDYPDSTSGCFTFSKSDLKELRKVDTYQF